MESVKKVWGSEYWIVNNNEYCGKILNLSRGFRCSIHKHKKKKETFYILKGEVFFELGNKKMILKKGDSITVNRGQYHRFTGLKNSKIIEFSTRHFDSDSYRKTLSEKVNIYKDK